MFTSPTQAVYTTPVPVPEDPAGNIKDDCRLWIGNLDTRLTEYTLLKLLQKFGELKRFDFLLHKLGPEKGKPRGYCFVSYENRKDAEKAKRNMHGKLALSKKLVVKWAHAETESEQQEIKVPCGISTGSTDSQIRAIEDKLRKMEESSSDFTISTKPVAQPGSSQLYQMNSAKQEQIKKPYSRKK
ncbi:probable RNA-binding protein 18 [Mytilus californianus]|uniref:probable RNA-binding protein 18 n=1 Tax=Mytilus californianus TaxID=6549 RepID=UPI0022478460|nr:probable RNA-binding protein 18 [Mytilus californianus]XP_052094448.1 probable RNA-binding protein 18 [Mytilus californianus]